MPSLLIACPSSWGMCQSETALWLAGLNYHLGRGTEIPHGSVGRCAPMGRIECMRNELVEAARRRGYSHLLMVDPDMVVDRYVGHDPRAIPFWSEAWSWMQDHPGSVIGVPARGQSPSNPVQVFQRTEAGQLVRMSDDYAIRCEGWHQVAAVGSGILLIDMAVFDVLDKPYFADTFWDADHAGLQTGQDVHFCKNCHNHNVPVWVNFSCWCGHVQREVVDKPYWDSLRMRSQVEVDDNDAWKDSALETWPRTY